MGVKNRRGKGGSIEKSEGGAGEPDASISLSTGGVPFRREDVHSSVSLPLVTKRKADGDGSRLGTSSGPCPIPYPTLHRGAEALAALRHSTVLTDLVLRLPGNDLRVEGAEELVALREAPRLRSLALDLSWNFLNDAGVGALAALKDMPALTALSLTLGGNLLTAQGVQALMAQGLPPSLRALEVDVSKNPNVGDAGAQAFAGLRALSMLKALSLSFRRAGAPPFLRLPSAQPPSRLGPQERS